MKSAEQLDVEIAALIGRGLDRRDEREFDRLALDLFEYQFARNAPYRNFCRRRQMEPSSVGSWKEIPAVPAAAFKEAALACFPVEESAVVFETSGTTESQARRGLHYLQTTDLYRASILPNFAAHLLPDGARLPMLMLVPSPVEAPRSSLSFMMGVVAGEYGGRGAHYMVCDGRLEAQRLCDACRMAENFAEPVFLLGTAFAFVHFFEWCGVQRQSFRLPAGSRAMETGGFKGRAREMPRNDLLARFEEFFSMTSNHVVNEYGMTELGVQFYDSRLRDPAPGIGRPALKIAPPWSRAQIIDPATGRESAEGERGLVRVFDLTNRSSVMAIQTEDIGMRIGEGFEVLGRATGSEARGCSIAADEFLEANSGE